MSESSSSRSVDNTSVASFGISANITEKGLHARIKLKKNKLGYSIEDTRTQIFKHEVDCFRKEIEFPKGAIPERNRRDL